MAGELKKKVILGEPSWVTGNDSVELSVTERGGHMAPVVFFRSSAHPVQPYYISPWQGKGVKTGVPVLDMLRGDFFCMPFGGGSYRGENHPAHGEVAGSRWKLLAREHTGDVTGLTFGMTTKVRRGRVTKRLMLVEGHDVVYCRHDLEGYEGRMCPSHHAILHVPDEPDSLRISVSPIRLGRVVPRDEYANAGNEYYFVAPGARFTSLQKVPTIWKDPAFLDCSTHPLPYGFMGLAAVFPRIAKTPAWTAVVMPSRGCVWFSLKDPRVLPQTMFWMSNGGRHAPPWNGVNRCLGVEDGCAYYTLGLADSVKKNDLNAAGIPTTLALSPDRPTRIPHIQGMARIPRGFDRVKNIFFGKDKIRLVAESGAAAEAAVRWSFLSTGEL